MNRLPDDIFVTYFSGYSGHMIEYKGVLYPTVEHAYHCQRYTDKKIIEEIRAARSPFKTWEASQKYKNQQLPDFNDRKASVMEELCRTKLIQHEDVARALRESGDQEIVKHITTGPKPDAYWDDGADGKGQNVTGTIWMKLRAELK
jgi:ribA/ribD-fused uncharacterized protein